MWCIFIFLYGATSAFFNEHLQTHHFFLADYSDIIKNLPEWQVSYLCVFPAFRSTFQAVFFFLRGYLHNSSQTFTLYQSSYETLYWCFTLYDGWPFFCVRLRAFMKCLRALCYSCNEFIAFEWSPVGSSAAVCSDHNLCKNSAFMTISCTVLVNKLIFLSDCEPQFINFHQSEKRNQFYVVPSASKILHHEGIFSSLIHTINV